MLPIPDEGRGQPANIYDVPFADEFPVDAQFPGKAGRRLVGRGHLAEGKG
jgi:hypothetical protein